MKNRLVALMPSFVQRELDLAGAEFSVPAGRSITSANLDGSFVYVVEGGVGSKVARSDSGSLSEVGMIGSEGMFPIGTLLNVPSACRLVVSQVGELYGRRIRTREFNAIIDESRLARSLLHLFAYSFLTQVSSNILTSEQDLIHKRLARWLLMCHDRINGDTIAITQDTLAQIVYAQRPTVTNALNVMRAEGIVDLSRGSVRIVDRPSLYRLADGAYGMSEEYWRENIGPFGKSIERKDPQLSVAG